VKAVALILAIAAALGGASNAQAGSAAAVDTLALGSGSGSRGTEVTVPLRLHSFDSIKAIQCDIHFDPGVVGLAGIVRTARVGTMALSYALVREDTLRVVMYYDDATELPPGDGAIAELTFLVLGAEGARSDLTPARVRLAGSAPQPIPVAASAGEIAVIAGSGEVPEVRLLSPNGGERWNSGSVQNIVWAATDPDTPAGDLQITLESSTDGGSTWSPVASGEANDSSYAWTVPDAETTEALVRVSAFDGSHRMWDVSDGFFEIVLQNPLNLVLSVLKNPGRTRTLQIVVWASRALDSPPEVHAGLSPVAMSKIAGLEAYEGRAFLGSGTRTVDVIAHAVSGPRERTARTTVTF
jgi:hypothetical protein